MLLALRPLAQNIPKDLLITEGSCHPNHGGRLSNGLRNRFQGGHQRGINHLLAM